MTDRFSARERGNKRNSHSDSARNRENVRKMPGLGSDHHRASDLVHPALLAAIEGDPDHADEAHREGDDEAEPAQGSLAETDWRAAVGVDDSHAQDALARLPPITVHRPAK